MEDGVSSDAVDSMTEKKPSLFVTCESREGVLFATLVGPSIGQRETPIISTAILSECERSGDPPRAVVMNFKDVAFMNSTGLGMCIEIRNAVHKRGGKVVLYRLNDQLVAVLKMTKMDRLYSIASDAAALEKLLQTS